MLDLTVVVVACLAGFPVPAAAPATQEPALAARRPSPAALESLGLRDATVQDLVLPDEAGAPFRTTVLLDGALRELVLEPTSLRAPGFQLLVEGADGVLREELPPPVSTYRGYVAGSAGSAVAASLDADGLSAVLRLAPGAEILALQPLSTVEPEAPRSAHVVHAARDAYVQAGWCGLDGLPRLEGAEIAVDSEGGEEGGTNFKICQIACDTDVEYYQAHDSSVAATENDIEKVLNGVTLIYVDDVEIIFQITTIIVRTANPDPYTTTSSGGMLSELANHWFFNQGGVVRDVAHLFTGKELDGTIIGIANLSSICSTSSGYSLVQSQFSSQFAGRVALSAHELGHNWAAFHCDGIPGCQIMCSGLGGCEGIGAFGPTSINSILNKKNSVGCLSNPPAPTLTSVAPSSVQALLQEEVTLSGTSFYSASTVNVGGTVLGEGQFTIAGDGKITFTAPLPSAVGPVSVTVTNQVGTTAAGTLTYAGTDPPVMIVPFTNQNGVPLTWTYGSGPSEAAIVWLSGQPATFLFEGLDILIFGFSLHSQFLSPAGMGGVTFPLPVLPIGTILYSQLITFDGLAVDASDVEFTVVIF